MNYFESQRGYDLCNLLFKLLREANDFLEQKQCQEQTRQTCRKDLPLELQLRLDVQSTLSLAAGDYSSRILSVIEDDIVADVMECSDYKTESNWSDGDITLAIGRVLCDRLGIKF